MEGKYIPWWVAEIGTVFVAGFPSCRLPVLKTSTGTHPFFKQEQSTDSLKEWMLLSAISTHGGRYIIQPKLQQCSRKSPYVETCLSSQTGKCTAALILHPSSPSPDHPHPPFSKSQIALYDMHHPVFGINFVSFRQPQCRIVTILFPTLLIPLT